jgi:hypothetical protein
MTYDFYNHHEPRIVTSINGKSGPITIKNMTKTPEGHFQIEGPVGNIGELEERMNAIEGKIGTLTVQEPVVDGDTVQPPITTIVGELDVSAGARIAGSVVTPLIQTWTASATSHSTDAVGVISGDSPYMDGITGSANLKSGGGLHTGEVNVKSGSTIIVMSGGTQAATSTGDINIETGDSVNGNSGDINIKTGLSVIGRGDVTLEGTHVYIGSEGHTPGLHIYGLDDFIIQLYVDGLGVHFTHPTQPLNITLPWGFAGTPPSGGGDGPGSAG